MWPELPSQMATWRDPPRLQPSVSIDAGDYAPRALYRFVLCGLSRVWTAATNDVSERRIGIELAAFGH
jgi:hypothetical protein